MRPSSPIRVGHKKKRVRCRILDIEWDRQLTKSSSAVHIAIVRDQRPKFKLTQHVPTPTKINQKINCQK